MRPSLAQKKGFVATMLCHTHACKCTLPLWLVAGGGQYDLPSLSARIAWKGAFLYNAP
jgi:hypothetical protein